MLSGCWDSKEPERIVYAHGVGFDYKDGKWLAYIQFIDLASMANMSGGGGSGGPASNIPDVEQATGRNVNEAFYHLYTGIDRRIYWGHLAYTILTERALHHKGLKWAVDLFNRYYDIRYHVFYYVTKNSELEKELVTVPIENIPVSLNKLSDPDSIYSQNSYVESKTARELIIDLNEPVHQVMLPYISVFQNGGPKKDQMNIKYDGVAVLTKNNLQGKLLKKDYIGMRWFNKNIGRIQVIIKNSGGYYAGVDVRRAVARVVPVNGADGNVYFNVIVTVKARVNTLIKQEREEVLREKLEEQIKKEIVRTYQVAIAQHIDPYRFSETLYRSNNPEWHHLQDRGALVLDKSSLNKVIVRADIKNSSRNILKPTLD